MINFASELINIIMALEIRSIPVLTGETAERFVREAEANVLNPKTEVPRYHFSRETIKRMITEGEELREKIDRGDVKLK